jgi:mono/diheme cytochrome c family protein
VLYHTYCVACHGDIVISAGVVPDLRYSAIPGTDGWNAVVRDGALRQRGMVGFGSVLSEEDAKAIESYVIVRARQSAETAQTP